MRTLKPEHRASVPLQNDYFEWEVQCKWEMQYKCFKDDCHVSASYICAVKKKYSVEIGRRRIG